jgi:hypothetical protein
MSEAKLATTMAHGFKVPSPTGQAGDTNGYGVTRELGADAPAAGEPTLQITVDLNGPLGKQKPEFPGGTAIKL